MRMSHRCQTKTNRIVRRTPTSGGQLAPGTFVTRFAECLNHPRWVYVLPNGDVLVAESSAPSRPEDGKGIKGWFIRQFMIKTGSRVPSADRITLLRDTNHDGIVDTRAVFLGGLRSPIGMTLVDNELYVANTDALLRYPYSSGQISITASGVKVTDLPAGPIDDHWTKNVIAHANGGKLYVTVGSNSNVAENGLDKESERASIWEIDPKTGSHRIFASGLRNPNGLAWEPDSGALWTTVNELQSDLRSVHWGQTGR